MFVKSERKCRMCKNPFVGKRSKIFCSPSCKSEYHYHLNKANKAATQKVDNILHRNRAILLELLGKKTNSKTIQKLELDKKQFNYSYVTAFHLNSHNKMVNHIYDFSWIIFSDDRILIKRKR